MKNDLQTISIIVIIVIAISVQVVQGSKPNSTLMWQHKVDLSLLTLDESETAEYLLILTEQGDISAAQQLSSREAKGQYVYNALTAVAQQTQAPLVAQIEEMGFPYRQYWIINMIWVKGDVVALEQLARRPEVQYIAANPVVSLETLPLFEPQLKQNLVNAIEWNLTHIGADLAWELGISGEGVVIGGQDTGYNWSHPGLINKYRGWDGHTADHDFNWHDTITSGGNGVCGSNSPEPCDDISSTHGTHTMGTAVGSDSNNQTGVAPDAKWIGCRNMNEGNGTPATYTECYEWFVAPYPIGGDPMLDGDPAKAPHVITNSWSCPPSEGCSETSMQMVVQNVRAAGIVTVHSAGNSGPGCSTVNRPAGHFQESFTVGSTTIDDVISSFSSRGAVTIGLDSWRKPDITAPGSNIRSTIGTIGYGSLNGTSMAAPHVAGLVALVISADPTLAGDVAAIEQLIQDSALPLTSNAGCGGDTFTEVPNNVYGYGRIDAFNAALLALDWEKQYLPMILGE